MRTATETVALKFKKRPTKRSLNKRTLDSLQPPTEQNGKPTQSWVYDSQTPRLAVCVWSSGSRVWYWIGRHGRQMIRFKLGSYPEISPEQARKLAAQTSAKEASGIDPRTDRRKHRDEFTLGELFDSYLEKHAKPKKASWKSDEQQFERYCKTVKSRPLSAISRSDMMALHARIGKKNGKYAANRLHSLLSKVFSFAAQIGFEGTNPCLGIEKFREQSRDRFLNADELKRFFEALEDESALFQDFFKLLLLTGARRSNVAAMRFGEIDFAEQIWRIPTTKNGEPLRVHLVNDAVGILERRRKADDGDYVFRSRRGKKPHMVEPKTAWDRVTERAGLKDVHMHDLRRTLGSWQAASGTSLPIIGKSLGHKSQTTTAIYARLDLEPVRASVNNAVSAMMSAANGQRKTNE